MGRGRRENCAGILRLRRPSSAFWMREFRFSGAKIAGITAVWGQLAEVLPSVCLRSAGLLARIRWKKSQSHPGWGRGYK